MATDDDTLTIQPLGPDKVAALTAFYLSLPKAVVRLFEPFRHVDEATIGARLAEVAEGKHISLGLFDRDGDVLGHGFVFDVHAEAPVFGIGLRPCVHGQGWGRKLMRAVLDEADRRGAPRLTLTVIKDNKRASSLYEKMGFVITGEAKCRTSGDSFAMERARPSAD